MQTYPYISPSFFSTFFKFLSLSILNLTESLAVLAEVQNNGWEVLCEICDIWRNLLLSFTYKWSSVSGPDVSQSPFGTAAWKLERLGNAETEKNLLGQPHEPFSSDRRSYSDSVLLLVRGHFFFIFWAFLPVYDDDDDAPVEIKTAFLIFIQPIEIFPHPCFIGSQLLQIMINATHGNSEHSFCTLWSHSDSTQSTVTYHSENTNCTCGAQPRP